MEGVEEAVTEEDSEVDLVELVECNSRSVEMVRNSVSNRNRTRWFVYCRQ